MKLHVNIITGVCVLVGTIAFQNCSTTPKTETAQDSIVNITEPEEHEHSHDPIALNNGKKWKVDDSMLIHIRNMEKEVSDFSSQQSTNYAGLAASLENHLDLLTSNCTMKGQAHDELHKWLLPFIDLTDELSAAENAEDAGKHFREIESSFVTFNQYFE